MFYYLLGTYLRKAHLVFIEPMHRKKLLLTYFLSFFLTYFLTFLLTYLLTTYLLLTVLNAVCNWDSIAIYYGKITSS